METGVVGISKERLKRAFYDVCSRQTNNENRQESIDFLRNLPRDRNTLLACVEFITDDEEHETVRNFASKYLVKHIRNTNPLVRPLMRIFLNAMKIPDKRDLMHKGVLVFIAMISDEIHRSPNHRHYGHFIVDLMVTYMFAECVELAELGAIILHGLLKNLSMQMSPFARAIAQGFEILLDKCKHALQNFDVAQKCHGLFFHVLMCGQMLAHHMSKLTLVLQPFQTALKDMLDMVMFLAEHGKGSHFRQVSGLLKLLLKNKNITGKKWSMVFKRTKILCVHRKFDNAVRLKALEILGAVIGTRTKFFHQPVIFYNMMLTPILVLCQEPAGHKRSESFDVESQPLPTPGSVAAEIIEFIGSKFPEGMVCDAYMKITQSITEKRQINVWKLRGLFIALGRICNRCRNVVYLDSKYLQQMTTLFNAGLIDICRHVRQAAVYAIQKLIVHFADYCNCWFKRTFLSYIVNTKLCLNDLKAGCSYHPAHIEMIFSQLKVYCYKIDTELLPLMPQLIQIFEHALKHVKISRVIVCAIELLKEAVTHLGVAILPYLTIIVQTVEPFLSNWEIDSFDEVRCSIIDLLAKLMLHASPYIMQIGGDRIIDLVYNMLQVQHARTQLRGSSLEHLLRYSPLRCSIFRFIQEIARELPAVIEGYIPKMLGTLIGTVSATKYMCPYQLDFAFITECRPEIPNGDDKCGKKVAHIPKRFKITNNDELEITKMSVIFPTFSLNDEILLAIIVLQNLTSSSDLIRPYYNTVFLRLSQSLRTSNPHQRKHILYALNDMLAAFMKDFQFENDIFLDLCLFEVIGVMDMATDITLITEGVRSCLYYIAVKEKHLRPNEESQKYLANLMKEIFRIITDLFSEGVEHAEKKEYLLNQVIAFMPKLATMCPPGRFDVYVGLYLKVFECKMLMPLRRSKVSDQKRSTALKKLIISFEFMEQDQAENFERISELFIKCLDDPVNENREYAAAGLGMLANHFDPQPVSKYKRILKVFWMKSKRERDDIVLDAICYGMVLTIKRNIWQQPILLLAKRLVHLLPIRHSFEYNMLMVEFFEMLCMERPSDITHIIREIYKYLLDLLDGDLESDIDPLYKRVLALAASLYSMHIEDLRQITISPITMQAILSACKNRACLRAILR